MSEVKDFITACQDLRGNIKKIYEEVRRLLEYKLGDELATPVAMEVAGNLELSYRHLEDARMRLGKAIQAADGGVSVYDK
jgi:hypothetical protein